MVQGRIIRGLPNRHRGVLVATLGALLVSQSATAKEDVKPEFQSFNVILVLDDGPIHARFGIAMNERPVADERESYIRGLVTRLDTNNDGELTQDEANQSYLLRRSISKGTARFIRKRGLRSKQKLSAADIQTKFKQVAGQPVVFRQVDDAFESDEYIFGLIDEDGSGIIDASEMTTVARRLMQRDADGDDCIGFDELQPSPAPQDPTTLVVGQAPADVLSHSVFSELMRPATDRFLPQRLLRKYDDNGNGKLSPKELRWSADRMVVIDRNEDGELSRSELAKIVDTQVDIDLEVDVAPFDGREPKFRVRHAVGQRVDRTSRPGIVSLRLRDATVTLSYRHVDPVPEAIENARRKFNLLDSDVNGYLEKTELEGELLFQRTLFDQMDTDADGKVFGEELDAYVRQRAEVKGMSCHVHMYDTGNGLFQAMDHNNDGRISARERRSSTASLRLLAKDAEPGLAKNEPARSYHIEFSRGAYLLFGRGEKIATQSISFGTQVTVGPPWFSGSDRNNDGDLTWNEFLGHREDFHFLDLDQDGLIDPIEAQRAEELADK